MLRMDMPRKDLLDDARRFGVRFQNQEEFRVFLNLLLELSQHTRRYSLRGHTPAELGLTAMDPAEAEKQIWDANVQNPVEKWTTMVFSSANLPKTVSGVPSKNAPCPCGSGRNTKTAVEKRTKSQ